MKHFFNLWTAVAVLAGLTACAKEGDGGTPAAPGSGSSLRLVVGIEGTPGSKATGILSDDETTEAKVNSLQVFVFNGNALDGYGSSTASKNAAVDCTGGLRDIYAVVNAPDLSHITSKEALLGTVSTLAEETGNFQMIGAKTETLAYDGTLTVAVDRVAARVVVRGIRNGLENAAQAARFKVLSVYLTNVAGDVDFGRSSTYAPSRWYNQRGYQAANNLGSFTCDEAGTDLAPGTTDPTVHFFYSCPNSSPAATGGPWTPRAARLVIKAEIAGAVYNYPILLPALESNKSYEINLVNITRVGNLDDGSEPSDGDGADDEERPVVGFGQDFTITVNPWTTVLVGNEEGITI